MAYPSADDFKSSDGKAKRDRAPIDEISLKPSAAIGASWQRSQKRQNRPEPDARDGVQGGLRRRVTVGVVWATAASWSYQALHVALFVMLGRLLGPEAYGTIAMALIITASCQVLIADGGWHESLVTRTSLEALHCDSLFWCLFASGSVIAIVVGLAAATIARVLSTPELAQLLPPLALTLPLAGLALVPNALLHRSLRFGALALASWLGLLAAGGIGVGMALADAGAWSLVGFHLAEATVTLIVSVSAARWRPRARFSLPHLRDIFWYSRNVFAENGLLLLDYLLPRFLVAVALGPVALGYFSIARKVTELLEEFMLGPLASVALPAFAAVRAMPARLAAGVALALRCATLIAFPAALGLAVVAPELVAITMGEAWAPSALILRLLALTLLAMPVARIVRALMQGVGKVGLQLRLTLLSTALLALLVGTLALTAGLPGVAAALALQPALMVPVYVVAARRACRVDMLAPLREALPALAAAGLMAAVLLVWRAVVEGGSDLFLLATTAPLGMAIYLATVAALDRPILREGWAAWRLLRERPAKV